MNKRFFLFLAFIVYPFYNKASFVQLCKTKPSHQHKACYSDSDDGIENLGEIKRINNDCDKENNTSDLQQQKKKVSFKETVFVVLIPERKEYFDAKLAQHMWNTQEDFNDFKQEAIEEIRDAYRNNQSVWYLTQDKYSEK